jgi:chorismate mutase
MALTELRGQIDAIDEQIIKLIAVRFQVVEQIVREKVIHGLPTFQDEREEEILKRIKDLGKTYGLSEDVLVKVFTAIMEESKRIQNEKRNEA